MSATELHKLLNEHGIIYRQSGQWLLHAPYMSWDMHSTRTYTWYDKAKEKTIAKPYLVWKQRGRRFILALFNNNFNVKLAIAEINGNKTK